MKKLMILLCLLLCFGCTKAQPEIAIEEEVTIDTDTNEIYDVLNRYIDSFMFDKKTLLSEYNGNTIEWEVVSGKAGIDDYVINKAADADEYEEITLKATCNGESYTFDNIVLCDEVCGYIITYFSNDTEDKETLKMAFTFDGLLWFDINNSESILVPSIGTKRLRDPSLMRNRDGGFYLLATEGYDNPSIYVYDSEDLISFENERLIQVNLNSDETAMSETQAWAPEGFYDRRYDQYFLYWSSPDDGGMYYNWSSDMESVTYPKKLLDCGFTVIDGTIFKDGYQYNIILKDEREPMEDYSQLFVGYSDTDYLNFDQFNMNYITGHQSEGPFVIYHGYNYVLYYDDYTRNQFKALYFYEFRNHDFYDVPEGDIVSSIENVSHAYALPITYKEYERINEYYEMD